MRKILLEAILVAIALGVTALGGYLAGQGDCEAAMRQDFAEGTPDSILFQVQMLAHWRAVAAQDRALALERVRRVVEAREAAERVKECNLVRQTEMRKTNWDYRTWRWYATNCPGGVR